MILTVHVSQEGAFTILDPVANPTVSSLDGEFRAPLRVLLSPSWSDADRALYGVYRCEAAEIPIGHRGTCEPYFEFDNGVLRQVVKSEPIDAFPGVTIARKGNTLHQRLLDLERRVSELEAKT